MMPTGMYSWQTIGKTQIILQIHTMMIQTTAEENTCYVINCEESITMWESPDISSPEICQIPLGTAVNVLQGAPNGFVQVDYEGMTGFCLGSYLSEIQ